MHFQKNIIIIILGSILLLQCTSVFEKKLNPIYADYDIEKVPYLLYKPDEGINLHWDLEEISGLSYYKDSKLLAVEDETGKVYILNSETGEVLNKVKFGTSGDYEGVEFDEGDIWVMESNGNFHSFQLKDDKAINIQQYKTEFTSKNDLEGLGFVKGALIVAAKADGEINGVDEKGKGIYVFKELKPEPLFFIEKDNLNKFIESRSDFNKMNDFDPSGIAINPMNGDYYILSADHIIVVYNSELKLKEVLKLDKDIFEQPEGICFSPDGALYISSEGNDSRGELFIFHPVTKKQLLEHNE